MSPFGLYQLHHVGIILPSLEDADYFMETMELKEDYRGYVDRWSCWCIFTKSSSGAVIELVTPKGGPLSRFNDGFGGVHHYAYRVDDISIASAKCVAKDLPMLEPEPVKGAGPFLCNFINPIATLGVQIEFVQML